MIPSGPLTSHTFTQTMTVNVSVIQSSCDTFIVNNTYLRNRTYSLCLRSFCPTEVSKINVSYSLNTTYAYVAYTDIG